MEIKGGPQRLIVYSKRTFCAGFKADPELWSIFKSQCKMRGVSVCHVLEALMEAWIQGQKATATVIKPVTVNLTMQHIVKKPRRQMKYKDIMYETQNKIWPPPCPKADHQFGKRGPVGCLDAKDLINLSECWRCFLMGLKL